MRTRILLLLVIGCLVAPMPLTAKPRGTFAGTWQGRIASTCHPRFVRVEHFKATFRVANDEKTVWDNLSGKTFRAVKRGGDTLVWSGTVPGANAKFASTLRLRGGNSAEYTSEMNEKSSAPSNVPRVRCTYVGPVSR